MADTTGIDWQRQSFAKGGTTPAAPNQMNPKTWGGPATSMNPKIAKPTQPCGGMVVGGYANGGMVRGYADGGEAQVPPAPATAADVSEEADKQAGLKASAGEDVGLKRLAMGNIDQPGSEAYNKFGAGRGAAERIKALPNDGSNDAAEARRLKMTSGGPTGEASVTPKQAEPTKTTTAAEFQRTDKDTSQVSSPVVSAVKKVAKAITNPTQAKSDDTAESVSKTLAATSVVRKKPDGDYSDVKDDKTFDENGFNFSRSLAGAAATAAATAARAIKKKSDILGSFKAR